jgi:hypothetical protein
MNTAQYIVLYDNHYPVRFVQNHQRVAMGSSA